MLCAHDAHAAAEHAAKQSCAERAQWQVLAGHADMQHLKCLGNQSSSISNARASRAAASIAQPRPCISPVH
eukprot:365289-Chlamydomonas_euryale.AAC.30